MSGFTLIALITIVIGMIVYYSLHSKVAKAKKQATRIDEEVVVAARFQYAYDHGLAPDKYKVPTFYTLTQCVHCDRLEKYLELNRIPFTKVLLDNYEGLARRKLMEKLRTFNPRGSFPTLVSPAGEVTVGFREAQVHETFIKYAKSADDAPSAKD